MPYIKDMGETPHTKSLSLKSMKETKVTVLKSQFSRKRNSMLNKTSSSGKSGLGSHDATKGSYVNSGDIAIGAGRMGTLNPVNSLGRQYLGDKAAVAARHAKQVKADRRAFVLGGSAA